MNEKMALDIMSQLSKDISALLTWLPWVAVLLLVWLFFLMVFPSKSKDE